MIVVGGCGNRNIRFFHIMQAMHIALCYPIKGCSDRALLDPVANLHYGSFLKESFRGILNTISEFEVYTSLKTLLKCAIKILHSFGHYAS